MVWPPKQMFVFPGFYESELDKVTVQDLVDHKVIAPIHAHMVEAETGFGKGAWAAMCDLGLKPATVTGLEVWAGMAQLRRERPELDEQELVSEGMRRFRGAVTPAQIKEALREKSLGSRA